MLHFVFSDVHGRKDLFEKVMNFFESQKEDWDCVFLGDACDRGPDGYEIMKHILADSRITYIKGNHEDMFVHACREILQEMRGGRYSIEQVKQFYVEWRWMHDIVLCLYNGGQKTIEAWIDDGCPTQILNTLDKLPTQTQIEGKDGIVFDLCHAGCTRDEWNYKYNEQTLLWNRNHFHENWQKGHILVHGHTPTPYLNEYIELNDEEITANKPIIYAHGTKIDMDTGMFFTDSCWILELSKMHMSKLN